VATTCKQLHRIQVGLIGPSLDSNPTSTPCRLYVFIIAGVAGVAAGVGSAVGVFTLAIMFALIATAGILVAKFCEKKGEWHLFGITLGSYYAIKLHIPHGKY